MAASVYVDDIIVSSDDSDACGLALKSLQKAADRSNFTFKVDKLQGPAETISAFNINVSNNLMAIDTKRLQQFSEVLQASTSQAQKAAILAYVDLISPKQAIELSDAAK